MLRAENGQLKDDMENRGASSQDSILKLNDKLASCQQREEELKNQNESLNKSLLDANEALEAASKQNQNMQLELEDRNTEKIGRPGHVSRYGDRNYSG